MAEALSQRPHEAAAAAATETRAMFIGGGRMSINQKPPHEHGHPCSVRLHGDVIPFLTDGWSKQVVKKLDHRVEVADANVLRCPEAFGKLIHDMLAAAPATAGHDLAPDNWVVSSTAHTPLDIAMWVVGYVDDKIHQRGDAIAAYDLDIEMPTLWVALITSEPDEVPAGVVAVTGRERCRESSEPCTICLSDMDTGDEEETVRLPCSHAFHSGCILKWYRGASTCPTCRHDIIEFCQTLITT